MKPATAASALKVQAALGPAYQVLEFDASTRTAAEAAAAIGCTVAQIAKSLVFRTAVRGIFTHSGRPTGWGGADCVCGWDSRGVGCR